MIDKRYGALVLVLALETTAHAQPIGATLTSVTGRSGASLDRLSSLDAI